MNGDFDFIFIGPHPDDVEIACGGTIAKLTKMNYKVLILDLTQGEMSSRGTVKTREMEAKKAADLLGVSKRLNLKLKDSQIQNTIVYQQKIAGVIREFRPRFAFVPYWKCRHPDHYHSSSLCYDALFLAGLSKFEDGQKAFRPDRISYYMLHEEVTPSYIVDVSEGYEKKIESILAYQSQFSDATKGEVNTYISGEDFIGSIKLRDQYFGQRIGRKFGEAFLIKEDIEIEDPFKFLSAQGKTLNRPMQHGKKEGK